MRWLTKFRACLSRTPFGQRLRCRRSGERGAVAVIVALVVVPVLLGASAIAIDASSLYVGRRQAQNAADAAALAIAQACAKGESDCTSDANDPEIDALVQANGDFGEPMKISSICRQFADGSCDSWDLSALPNCPVKLPSDVNGVQARVESKISLIFVPLLDANTTAVSPSACSSAAWGPPDPQSLNTLPFAISACEWGESTNYGDAALLAEPPPYDPVTNPIPDGKETAMLVNAPLLPESDPCYSWQSSGHDFPGGFGWLEHDPYPSCKADIGPDDWVGAIAGGALGDNDCGSLLKTYVGKVVHLPIFNCKSLTKTGPGPVPPCSNDDNGTKSYYHIQSSVAFFVTAYDLPSLTKAMDSSHPTSAAKSECVAKGGSGAKCLYGWFVKDVSSGVVGPPDTPDYGLSVIQLVG